MTEEFSKYKMVEDRAAVKRCLDRTEHFLTADIDFASYMG